MRWRPGNRSAAVRGGRAAAGSARPPAAVGPGWDFFHGVRRAGCPFFRTTSRGMNMLQRLLIAGRVGRLVLAGGVVGLLLAAGPGRVLAQDPADGPPKLMLA